MGHYWWYSGIIRDLPRTDPSAQSSRLGFFRAGYTAAGIYAASTAKRVASQKSPCKNEERSKEGDEEEENGERYRLKTVKSGSTLSPVQLAKRLSLFSLVLLVLWTPNPIKGRCARSEKRSAWRIAAEVRSPRRFVNRPIAAVRERRRHRRRPPAKMPQKSDVTRFGYPVSRPCVPSREKREYEDGNNFLLQDISKLHHTHTRRIYISAPSSIFYSHVLTEIILSIV